MQNAIKNNLFMGCTESPKRREQLRRTIEQETKEFLAKGNTIKPLKNNLQPIRNNKEPQQ